MLSCTLRVEVSQVLISVIWEGIIAPVNSELNRDSLDVRVMSLQTE